MYSICCLDELLAKVNKNLKSAKENREKLRKDYIIRLFVVSG